MISYFWCSIIVHLIKNMFNTNKYLLLVFFSLSLCNTFVNCIGIDHLLVPDSRGLPKRPRYSACSQGLVVWCRRQSNKQIIALKSNKQSRTMCKAQRPPRRGSEEVAGENVEKLATRAWESSHQFTV